MDDALNRPLAPIEPPSKGKESVPPRQFVDKCLQFVPKLKTRGTQYQLQNFLQAPKKQVQEPVKVKIAKPTKMKSVGTDTHDPFPINENLPESEPEEQEETTPDRVDLDESFHLTEEMINENKEETVPDSASKPLLSEEKFIVSLSSLKPLLVFCTKCHKRAHITDMQRKGTLLRVSLLCEDNHDTVWLSQPKMDQGMASGNLSIAASILLSGSTFQSVKEMMEIGNIDFIGTTTFYDLQKRYIIPAINKVYLTYRELRFAESRDNSEKLNLLGDGRCDSPGHCAKYGTYTLMNSDTGEIMDFHVSHVSIAGNSQRMELDGLKNLIYEFEANGLEIESLTTDRHKMVRAYLRKEKPYINHQFDVWHVGKNILKKLLKEAKRKSCRDLAAWIKSIVNHFWWCCASCNGNATEMKEKWLSILFHVCNIHRWKNSTIFKKCEHRRLTKKQQKEKVWLKKGSAAYNALVKVVTSKTLLSAMNQLTSFSHTGTLEVYHSLYNKYCPKRLHFSYEGMIARSQLAVLDFNSGVNRSQAKTRNGELRYKLSHTKITKSWVVKKIMEKKTRPYLKEIMDEVEYQKLSGENHPRAEIPENVPKNIAPTPRPDKKAAIASMCTRFKVYGENK